MAKKSISKSSPGLTQFAFHFGGEKGSRLEKSIRSAAPRAVAAASGDDDPLASLDAESAARIHLDRMLASDELAGLNMGDAAGRAVEFKSLGTQAIPFTATTIVKFRQFVDQVPVFGSFIAVEVDKQNKLIAVDSSYTQVRSLPDAIAKASPEDAVKTVQKTAKVSHSLKLRRPRLFYYFDSKKDKWQLAYIVENAPAPAEDRKRAKGTKKNQEPPAVVRRADYIINAKTGSLLHAAARNFGVARSAGFPDELGNERQITFELAGRPARATLVDAQRKIRTFDLKFKDVDREPSPLPGTLLSSNNNPAKWSTAAVSAHANAAAVLDFLRLTLRRDSIDDRGAELISSINCISSEEPVRNDPRGYYNAFWNSAQMAYGQVLVNVNGREVRRSLACALDIVAHEIFHGVTERTSDLVYERQSGALNESYSDIFGVMINNASAGLWQSADRAAEWQWLIGSDIDPESTAFRSMSRPNGDPRVARSDWQPMHFRNYRNLPADADNDYGGVHINSGIPNYCAYLILTAKDNQGRQHFTADEAAQLFYITLIARLNRNAGFTANRAGLLNSARSLFRNDPDGGTARVAAVTKACNDVGV